MYSFNEDQIRKHAPDEKGVYTLFDDRREVIYFGKAEISRRSRLLRHLNGDEGPCTKLAIYFYTEYSSNPANTERNLLEKFLKENGKLPKCNDRIG